MAMAMSIEEKSERAMAMWELAQQIERWMAKRGILEVAIDGIIIKKGVSQQRPQAPAAEEGDDE